MRTLKSNVIALYKEKGEAWFNKLPQFLSRMEKQLAIKLQPPFSHLNYNYVAPAIKENKPYVLKCCIPNKALNTEITALEHYNGNGAIQLIDSNAEQGWLLLERCEPGDMLLSVDDDEEATTIAVNIMQQLWKPIQESAPFPTISDWLLDLKPSQLIPKQLMDFAIETAKDLLASQGELVLLHGDLHHYNILSSKRQPWLAIDPKGVIGEREYDIGALMRNPIPKKLTKKLLENRLDKITELTGFDKQRLLRWSIVQATLATFWCINDSADGQENLLYTAQTLRTLST